MKLLPLFALFACGPTSVVLDDKRAPGTDDTGATDSGDPGSTDDSGADDSGADDSGAADSGDTDDTDDTAVDACAEYGAVVASAAVLAYGASIDSYDASAGTYSNGSAGSGASVAVNGSSDCALENGATIAGDVWVHPHSADTYCEAWGVSVSGAVRELTAAASLPAVALPSSMPDSSGSLTVAWGETAEWAADARYDAVSLQYGAAVEVLDDLTLVVGSFDNAGSPIEIAAGKTLNVYVTEQFKLSWGSNVNVGGQPGQLNIYAVGDATVTVDSGAALGARVFAPEGEFISAGTHYGTLVAKSARMDWGAAMHQDVSEFCP